MRGHRPMFLPRSVALKGRQRKTRCIPVDPKAKQGEQEPVKIETMPARASVPSRELITRK